MALKRSLLNVEEYLEFEAKSPVKHDYVAGEVFALAGTTDIHNQLALNLVVKLWASARARGCRVFASDMKVRTPRNALYYPDVMVVCDEDDNPLVKTKPCLIIEVLSKSTELIDKREKLEAYQSIPSLQTYALVASEGQQVDYYAKREGTWLREVVTDENNLYLACLDLSLSLADIYEGL